MTVSPITSKQKVALDKLLSRARKGAEKGKISEDLQRLFARGGEFEDAYVALFNRFTAKLPDYMLAKSILGGDFITAEEIMVARPGVVYSPEQIEQLASTLPSEDVLRSLKSGGYGLMPQPPSAFSLLDVRAIEAPLFYTPTGGWYEKQLFASTNKTGAGWLAIRKTPVNGSTNKSWEEQNNLLSGFEIVPSAAEMSWFITTFYKVRGIRLFEKVYVRCSDIDSGGSHVDVGLFDVWGLDVFSSWDSKRLAFLGLASARKF